MLNHLKELGYAADYVSDRTSLVSAPIDDLGTKVVTRWVEGSKKFRVAIWLKSNYASTDGPGTVLETEYRTLQQISIEEINRLANIANLVISNEQ